MAAIGVAVNHCLRGDGRGRVGWVVPAPSGCSANQPEHTEHGYLL